MTLYKPTAQLKIALTGRCTNDCAICFNDTRRRDNASRSDLPVAQIRDAITAAAEMGLSGVYWTGGEPLLRYTDMVELTRHAKSVGLPASMVTNAAPLGAYGAYREKNETLLREAGTWDLSPEQMVEELRDAGLTRVFLSVDNSHNTDQDPERAPANRVPTKVVSRALDALLDGGFGHRSEQEFIGHRLRISVTGNGEWRGPSERMLADVLRTTGLTEETPNRFADLRGSVQIKFLETANVGAALVLPSRLLEKRTGKGLFGIRCGNMEKRADAYDGGRHHQDLSINHEGTVSLCGNFMYPIGRVQETSLDTMVGDVNRGSSTGSHATTVAVLHRLFRISDDHGASAIGEAFRIIHDEDPELLRGLSTEGGACHALGRDPELGQRFVDAFDRRSDLIRE